MDKTKSGVAILGAAFGLWISFSNANAQESETCKISDEKVVCASSLSDRKTVFDAMANPKSTRYFKELLAQPNFSLDVNRRETYRRSLERNRRAMHRYARSQLRDYRRRKINSETYEKTVSGYKSAVATYTAAMNIYRGTVWHSKTKSRFAD